VNPVPVEQEIMAEWRGKVASPLVSVCCITYNHAAYIEETLRGFLMQRTDFAFEILIHDDASTDGTADIVRRYAERYPHLVRAVCQRENQYARGHTKVNFEFNFPRVQGEFIALCEGDDAWTDPYKLQQQVDHLRAHPGCTVCAHLTEVVDQEGRPVVPERVMGDDMPEEFRLADVLDNMKIHVNSCVFRRLGLPDFIRDARFPRMLNAPGGDDPMMWIALSQGTGHLVRRRMSCYRLHEGGVWSAMSAPHKQLARLQIRLLAPVFVPVQHWPRLAWIISRDAAELLFVSAVACVRRRSLLPLSEVWQAHRNKRATSTLALLFACGGGVLVLPWKLVRVAGSILRRRMRPTGVQGGGA
jgi:glycosyltransferase involved in cell wall biosynthesis